MGTRTRVLTVGTTPVIAFVSNGIRKAWRVLMFGSSDFAGNTGRVHVAKGFVPSSVLGAPDQGDFIKQTEEVAERERFPDDPTVYKGDVWVIASAASQTVLFEEED